ncbi:MAG: hypothetical protein H0A76_05155 [Candidatus Thiodubiliella endoseptemdiera]|uniref:LPS-assembly lipoprotein LptE n=1 Tax=Candidatus Thiodubiliella endoseptemdiera TaxID=2738886 RepID=A0A853F500_9GAMM|nr:hypothetical protein [Candidatus Thiodubiliella endoseptemdiera]
MSKINLLAIILISTLLSACGFHTPNNITSLNASITGNTSGAFAVELKKHFNTNAVQLLTVQIGNEVQKQQTVTYSAGIVSSYSLTLGVPIKIFQHKKLLLVKTLTANTTMSKLSLQANRLQITTSYTQLRKDIVTKLLRRLKALNAD